MYNTIWENTVTAGPTADTVHTILGDFTVTCTKKCAVCGSFSTHATVVQNEFWLCDSCARKLQILLSEIID